MKRKGYRPEVATGALSENDTKRYFSTVGFAVFAFVAVSYGVSFLLTLLLTRFAPDVLKHPVGLYGLSVVTQYGIALPVALLILKGLPKDVGATEKLGFGTFLGAVCMTFTFMTVGNTIGQNVTGLLGSLMGKDLLNPVAASTEGVSPWINLIFMAILAPVLEEILFRKIFCDRLLPLGEGYAIFLSAFIFGATHGNLYQFFYAFFVGLLFAGIYVRTGRLRYTITLHVIINALGGVFMPWVVDKLSPILTEEVLMEASEVLASQNAEAIEAFAATLEPYALYMMLYGGYVLLNYVLSIVGVFVFMRTLRRTKLRSGLLPPAKEGRVANLFCNAGVAAAITAFVGLFVLSLL